MARMPRGAEHIDNPVSVAPGFRIGNVHVMAGVPSIFQAMLDNVVPTLRTGTKLLVGDRPVPVRRRADRRRRWPRSRRRIPTRSSAPIRNIWTAVSGPSWWCGRAARRRWKARRAAVAGDGRRLCRARGQSARHRAAEPSQRALARFRSARSCAHGGHAMSYKTIVAIIQNRSDIERLLEAVVPLASRLGSHLIGIHAEPLPAPMTSAIGFPDAEFVVTTGEINRKRAAELEALFKARARRSRTVVRMARDRELFGRQRGRRARRRAHRRSGRRFRGAPRRVSVRAPTSTRCSTKPAGRCCWCRLPA